MNSSDPNTMDALFLKSETADEGSMDHILDILASHGHPFVLVGSSAQRWMGSRSMLTNGCDMLVRDSALNSIASDLVCTGHWEPFNPGPHTHGEAYPPTERDADFVLRRTGIIDESEYHYLSL
jgi:hypothetical protein